MTCASSGPVLQVVINDPNEYTADDPPRCYLKEHPIPGAAFTRSIGDALAESIGVIPTPEAPNCNPKLSRKSLSDLFLPLGYSASTEECGSFHDISLGWHLGVHLEPGGDQD